MKRLEKFNKQYGTNYDFKKMIYFILVLLLILNLFCSPTTADINSVINANTNINQINTQENVTPLIPSLNKKPDNEKIIENNKEVDSKEKTNENNEKKIEKNKNEKQEKNNDGNNQEKIDNNNENNRGKKKVKGFWKKLFLMTGFLGIIYYLVWKESNDPGHYGDDDDDKNNKNEKDKKNKKKENDGYLLINNNEDIDI
jgi:ATP-dependent Zn protease